MADGEWKWGEWKETKCMIVNKRLKSAITLNFWNIVSTPKDDQHSPWRPWRTINNEIA
jgi:hypothetical protein